MATYVKYEVFVEDLIKKVHNFTGGTDVFKVSLTNTTPVPATHAVRGDIAELATAGGYTAGGNTTTMAVSRSGGTAKATGTDPTSWTGTGSGFTFSHAVLYNDTPVAPVDPLIANWAYGSSQLVGLGETLTVDFDGTNGIFTVT
jgi:hypothetical protein